MVANALDHGDRAGVAHGKALARNTAEIALALGRAVKHGVADNDRFFGDDLRLVRRADDDTPPDRPLPT
jgi:hypothetical protein